MKSKLLVFATILGVFLSVTPTTAQIITSSQTITTKTQIKKEKVKKERKILPPVSKGYQQSLEFTFSTYDLSVKAEESFQFGIDYIGGYRFSNYFFAGVGIGLNFNNSVTTPCLNYGWYVFSQDDYAVSGINENVFKVPLYLHIRLYMTKTRCQPFFALSLGGQISGHKKIENDTGYFPDLNDWTYSTSSFFLNPELGVSYRITEKYNLYLAIGFMARTSPVPFDGEYPGRYGMVGASYPYDIEIRHPMLPFMDFNLGFTF